MTTLSQGRAGTEPVGVGLRGSAVSLSTGTYLLKLETDNTTATTSLTSMWE